MTLISQVATDLWRNTDRSLRFLPPSVAEKYDLDMPKYEGVDQILEVGVGEQEPRSGGDVSGMAKR